MDSLRPCPSTPNCVCSVYEEDKAHYIHPFIFASPQDAQHTFQNLEDTLAKYFDIEIEQRSSSYIHFIFRTSLLKFKDDVEFVLDENRIHVRSASRVGYSDLGTNRKRIQKIHVIMNAVA